MFSAASCVAQTPKRKTLQSQGLLYVMTLPYLRSYGARSVSACLRSGTIQRMGYPQKERSVSEQWDATGVIHLLTAGTQAVAIS
jgi:hypothetical protein